jgi:hypothetical protein
MLRRRFFASAVRARFDSGGDPLVFYAQAQLAALVLGEELFGG